MSGIFQDFSIEQWKTGLPDTIQVSRAEYEALQAECDEAVRQLDKFYGEANLERGNAATYRTVLEMCVSATGEEIPFGDLSGTIEDLRRDAERYRFIRDNGVYHLQYEIGECGVGTYRGENADKAIDAAINGKGSDE